MGYSLWVTRVGHDLVTKQPDRKKQILYYLYVETFFLVWTILKIFIEFIIILLLFYVLVFFWPRSIWNLGTLTRN